MSVRLLLDAIFIVGFVFCIFFALSNTRARARWGKLLFAATGLLGLAYGVAQLMSDTHWLALTRATDTRLHNAFHFTRGLLLGLLLALVVSGQVLGAKRDKTQPSI